MSGVSIQVTAGSRQVRDAIAALVAAGRDLREPFDEIGASLLTSTQQRIQDEETPEGERWPELAESTQKRWIGKGSKRTQRGKDHMLRVKDLLYAAISYTASASELMLGTNKTQAALLQFGGTEDMPAGPRAVPARPYVGLSADDENEIGAILTDYLTEAWG